MIILTFENAIYSWITFWVFYWISGIYLSYKAHHLEIRKVVKLSKVINVLGKNMIWTFVGTIILFYIPIKLITTFNIVIRLLLCLCITEIYFYHLHLLVHSKPLYKRFHKMHHEFTDDTFALTALYCTGYEAVIVNLFAVALGPVMLSIPIPYLYIWFAIVAVNSTFTHSGMTLGFLIDGSHDLHHKTFDYNFGTLTIFERIYGTYKTADKEI